MLETTKQNISQHIKNAFEEEELDVNSVVKNFLTTAQDGKNYNTKYYNLDVIISVGYRVKSSSEKVFYRQILDIYAKSIDYNPNSAETKKFFKVVQNKMHFAAHGHTTPEIIS